MNPDIIDKFKMHFNRLPDENAALLEEIYESDAHFQDPIRTLKGIVEIHTYLQKFNANVRRGGYKFTQQSIRNDRAYLSWELDLEYKIPQKRIAVSGITVLLIGEKVISQRNYYDAGAFFYEHLPLIGPFIRYIKRKLLKCC
ncbi:nuclear transport factor 2 family protein [Dyadobacter sp. CY326]|uniref:nuclear transport factor 2 family protein n=1 Tax=Dyadobacter sp. CY326 TaxID=2907300 RepID=UPI001F41D220|nr:nuclear transport factor 2 family protein [Dyadobacter sp. CY326]MCE7066972.1 nuclear transport factor 2 family protein [Dyadobacter sp. CY326]